MPARSAWSSPVVAIAALLSLALLVIGQIFSARLLCSEDQATGNDLQRLLASSGRLETAVAALSAGKTSVDVATLELLAGRLEAAAAGFAAPSRREVAEASRDGSVGTAAAGLAAKEQQPELSIPEPGIGYEANGYEPEQARRKFAKTSGIVIAYFMKAADISRYRKEGRYDNGKHAYYSKELRSLCMSLHKHSPKLKMSIVTDSEEALKLVVSAGCREEMIEHVIMNQMPLVGLEWGEKMNALLQTPYERTLLVDVDITACADLTHMFEFLQYYDVAMVQEPYQIKDADGVKDLLSKDEPFNWKKLFLQNTGVILYQNNEKVRHLWNQMMEEFPKVGGDQPLYQLFGSPKGVLGRRTDIRVLQLPPEYNVRVYGSEAPRVLTGVVKLWHGKKSTGITCEHLNERHSYRLWSSSLGTYQIPLSRQEAERGKAAWSPVAGVDAWCSPGFPSTWLGSERGGYHIPTNLSWLASQASSSDSSSGQVVAYLVGSGYDLSAEIAIAAQLYAQVGDVSFETFDPTPGIASFVRIVKERMAAEQASYQHAMKSSEAPWDKTHRLRALDAAAVDRPEKIAKSLLTWTAEDGPTPSDRWRHHTWALGSRDEAKAAFSLLSSGPKASARTLAHIGEDKKPLAVEAKTLSATMRALGHERVHLLKLDVEGAEADVLRNMLASVSPLPLLLLVEFDSLVPGSAKGSEGGEEYSRALLTDLKAAGYKQLGEPGRHGSERTFVYCPHVGAAAA